VVARYGYTQAETVIRGVRALDVLNEMYIAKATKVGGDEGALLKQIVDECGVELLVNRDLQWGRNDDTGAACLYLEDDQIVTTGPPTDDFPDGPLIVTRPAGANAVEVSVVHNGRLASVGLFPLGETSMN